MAAIKTLETRDALVASLVRRSKSWPAREPGVMVVLCIVFVVGCAVVGLWASRMLKARKEKAAIKSAQAGH